MAETQTTDAERLDWLARAIAEGLRIEADLITQPIDATRPGGPFKSIKAYCLIDGEDVFGLAPSLRDAIDQAMTHDPWPRFAA